MKASNYRKVMAGAAISLVTLGVGGAAFASTQSGSVDASQAGASQQATGKVKPRDGREVSALVVACLAKQGIQARVDGDGVALATDAQHADGVRVSVEGCYESLKVQGVLPRSPDDIDRAALYDLISSAQECLAKMGFKPGPAPDKTDFIRSADLAWDPYGLALRSGMSADQWQQANERCPQP